MPSEEISAQQGNPGNVSDMWAANHRTTQADYDLLSQWAAKMNPAAGEAAPKYFNAIDPKEWAARTFADPNSPGYGISTGFGAGAPSTVYGDPNGRFVQSDSGGRGGQTIGGIVQLGGSKSQGPSFDQLGSNSKYDRSQAVWDDNYGWILPKPQQKGNSDDWVTQALMTGASLAAGGVIPTWAMAAIQGAQGYGNGQSLGKIAANIAPSIIGAGLGGNLNLPPEVMQALQAAKYLNSGYGAYKQFQQGNPIGGGLTIGKLAGNFIPTGG